MERKYIVYQHTTPSGKVYIGQTSKEDPNQRWRDGNGYKGCKLFYNSIKKYGWDNIEHKILHTGLTKEKADILEKMYIHFFKRKNISLNITDGGEGHTGYIASPETRKKLSDARKGKSRGPHSEETRRKMSEAGKRKVFTDEHRRKLSEANKGKFPTEETRRKMSEAGKRKVFTDEHRRKLSEAGKGKVFTDEHRRKISESKKGKHQPLKKSIYLDDFNHEVEMDDVHAKRYHPNWVKVRDL